MTAAAANSSVFDLHCDAVLKLVHRSACFATDNAISHVDIPKMRKGGVGGIFFSLWSDPVFEGTSAVGRTQYMLDRCLAEIASCDRDLFLSTTAADLQESEQTGKIAALLGIEGGHSINNNLKHLETFHRQGVRRMTLTHTKSTDWAGSATDGGKGRGLSDFGKEVVLAMNALGMAVDVAHTSEKTVLDAAEVSHKPVFCTHSLARAVCESDRLATDRMIRAIGESGGIFGLTFLPMFFPNQNQEATKVWTENLILELNASPGGTSLEERAQMNAALYMDSPPPCEVAALEGLLPHADHIISLIGSPNDLFLHPAAPSFLPAFLCSLPDGGFGLGPPSPGTRIPSHR